MQTKSIRHHLRTVLCGASLLSASLLGAACIEGVVEVPEDEVVGEYEQGITPKVEANKTVFSVDGRAPAWLNSATGGAKVLDISEATDGTFRKKGLQAVRFELLTLQMNLAGVASIDGWIADNFRGKLPEKDLELTYLDINNKPKTVLTFQDALVAEIGVPALDLSSDTKLAFSVKVLPKGMRQSPGSGGALQSPNGKGEAFANKFSVQLGDLDCSRVVRVEPFTVKTPTGPAKLGQSNAIDFPDLRFTFSTNSEPEWVAHMDKVIEGGITDLEELAGAIELLGANEKVIATIALKNVGIKRIGLGADGRLEADMYVEQISLDGIAD